MRPFHCFPRAELRAYEASKGIAHQSWSPLGQGSELLAEPALASIAAKHGATPAQVDFAWHLALGNVVIPKSVTPARIVENYGSLALTRDDDDLSAIAALDQGTEGRISADPAVSDFA